jgi:hypothetical protein
MTEVRSFLANTYKIKWLPTVDNLRCAKQSLVFLIGCKSQLSKV